MSAIYEEHKDEDGFLYVRFASRPSPFVGLRHPSSSGSPFLSLPSLPFSLNHRLYLYQITYSGENVFGEQLEEVL